MDKEIEKVIQECLAQLEDSKRQRANRENAIRRIRIRCGLHRGSRTNHKER